MTKEEFEIFKKELMERFYWANTRAEYRYLTKVKGHRYLFRCTHYRTGKYFWVYDLTDNLLKDVADFHEKRREEKNKLKESEDIAAE